MDTLSHETWDVVIAGTGLPQSLLALSLSRSDLKILHVDRNSYYGGDDAGLGLDEVAGWASSHDNSSITRNEAAAAKLASSRSYTLSLNSQVIYAQSRFLPALVSSQIHTQLEFLAVGSIYVQNQDGTLQKIPSNREDVFADDKINMRDKRKLMNLLRHVTQDHDEGSSDSNMQGSLQDVLSNKFKISKDLQAPVSALSLSTGDPAATNFEAAAERLRRHLLSVGYFGPGLGAVIAKYGSNSEIAQVACRASAVGGATYLLGHGVKEVNIPDNTESHVEVVLSDGTTVRTKRVVGTFNDLPSAAIGAADIPQPKDQRTLHQVAILSSSLPHLFAPLAENGTIPAAVIIMSPDLVGNNPPVYLQIHTHETGECPRDQVVLYASTTASPDTANNDSKNRLSHAVDSFIEAQKQHDPRLECLWQFSYQSSNREMFAKPLLMRHSDDKVLVLPSSAYDLAFDDSLLDVVKEAWSAILGDAAAGLEFLRYEERRGDDGDL